MKNKKFLIIGIILLTLSLILGVYLLSKQVNKSNSSSFLDDVKIVDLNKETDKLIYYFSIKNSSDVDYNYDIILESNSDLNGNSLNYKLISNNEIIKEGELSTDNILDSNVIEGNSTKNYSLIITSENSIESFNYKISIEENNKIHS